MNIVKVVSAALTNGRRIVTVLRRGQKDVQDADQSLPSGVDSSPVANMTAVFSKTSLGTRKVIVGYLKNDQLASQGEVRLFSVDSSGTLQTYLWIKNDGTVEIRGSGDNMVRFSKLKESVDELKNDLTTLKSAFTGWVPVANDGGAALKTATATWHGTALVKNIDDAKINEIKTT